MDRFGTDHRVGINGKGDIVCSLVSWLSWSYLCSHQPIMSPSLSRCPSLSVSVFCFLFYFGSPCLKCTGFGFVSLVSLSLNWSSKGAKPKPLGPCLPESEGQSVPFVETACTVLSCSERGLHSAIWSCSA